MNKMYTGLLKHGSKILTGLGTVGVVVTTVSAVKATPKALTLIEDKKDELGVNKLTVTETIKTAWKPFIPTIISGFSTIACILGIDCLSVKNQATLMSAYAALDNAYKEYQKAVKKMYSDKDSEEYFDSRIKEEIVKAQLVDKDSIEIHDDKQLFWDYQTMRYFESTMDDVKKAEAIFKEHFELNGFACLNDYYEILGIPPVDYGYRLGWDINEYDNDSDLKFDYQDVDFNGMECCIITLPYHPMLEY